MKQRIQPVSTVPVLPKRPPPPQTGTKPKNQGKHSPSSKRRPTPKPGHVDTYA